MISLVRIPEVRLYSKKNFEVGIISFFIRSIILGHFEKNEIKMNEIKKKDFFRDKF